MGRTILLRPPEGSPLLDDPHAPYMEFGARLQHGVITGKPKWYAPGVLAGPPPLPRALLLVHDGQVQLHSMIPVGLANARRRGEDDRTDHVIAYTSGFAYLCADALFDGEAAVLFEHTLAAILPGGELIYLDEDKPVRQVRLGEIEITVTFEANPDA